MKACSVRARGSPSAMAMRPSAAIRPVVVAPRVVARASVEQQDSDMKAAEARWDAQVNTRKLLSIWNDPADSTVSCLCATDALMTKRVVAVFLDAHIWNMFDRTLSLNNAKHITASMLRDGIVKNVMARDLKSYTEDGWMVLDVRPPSETRKVHVSDAVEVPLFVPDTSLDPSSLLKQMSAFGLGGWWLGGTHMKPNNTFMADVQAKIPKDAKVIVACQKGLRSLAAAEQLSRAGYADLAWVNGGLDNSTPGDVPTRDDKDVRYAGIGGVSEMVGWTEVQQENAGPAGSLKSVFIAVGLILVLDGLVFAYEQYQYMQGKVPFQ